MKYGVIENTPWYDFNRYQQEIPVIKQGTFADTTIVLAARPPFNWGSQIFNVSKCMLVS